MPKTHRGGRRGGTQPQTGPQNGKQPTIQILIQQGQASANGGSQGQAQHNNNTGNDFHAGEGNDTLDWTNNNNPETVKYQQSDDAKAQKYLARLGKAQTQAQDAEGYPYHNSAFQNMVIAQDINSPVYATLSKAQFNQYCQQTGLQPFYRGSTQSSNDRFVNAAAYHSGTGMYGEGTYFGSKSTANSYGSSIMTCALSPNARVVDLADVQARINSSPSGLRGALAHSGNVATSQYSSNSGEAQMAIKMGANVIRTSWCYVVLSRDAVVVRK